MSCGVSDTNRRTVLRDRRIAANDTDKVDLVKNILVSLADALRSAARDEKRRITWTRLDPSAFIALAPPSPAGKTSNKDSTYDALFNLSQPEADVEEDDPFSAKVVDELVDNLGNDRIRLPLTRNERSLLATLAKAVLEATVQRRALDAGGMRYLFSLRMYVHELQAYRASITTNGGDEKAGGLSQHASSVTLVPDPTGRKDGSKGGMGEGKTGRTPRLSFRNIVWASHSESQEVMLTAATECCQDGKMGWEDAKRLGVFLWLRSAETVVSFRHPSPGRVEGEVGRLEVVQQLILHRDRSLKQSPEIASWQTTCAIPHRAPSSFSPSARKRSSMVCGARHLNTRNKT